MPAKRRVTSQSAKQARARWPRLVGLLIAAAGGLVVANNAGVLPEGWGDRLLVTVEPYLDTPHLPALTSKADDRAERDEADDEEPPVPRAEPPANWRDRLRAPRPPRRAAPDDAEPEPPRDEPRRREPKPEPDPEPAPRTPPRPAIRPTPEPARPPAEADRPAGVLSPETRRARLAGIRLTDGFTQEWSGGPAALTVAANELSRGPSAGRRVALTLDGHFEPELVDDMLETLRAHRVKATFFLTGRFARRYPSAVRRIAAGGHEVANHSDTHPNLTKLPEDEVLAEVERAEAAIVAAAGAAYRPYFRAPFGDRDVRTLRLLIRAGFVPVYWSLDTLDWKEGTTPEQVIERIEAKGLEPGGIILAHVGSEATARALPRILTRLAAEDLRVGRLGDLLESDG